jgi:hypothetical protein
LGYFATFRALPSNVAPRDDERASSKALTRVHLRNAGPQRALANKKIRRKRDTFASEELPLKSRHFMHESVDVIEADLAVVDGRERCLPRRR